MTITLTWSGFFEVVGMVTCGGLAVAALAYALFIIFVMREMG